MERLLPQLLPRAYKFGDCTLSTCPVSDSVYGYLPSKPATILFVALFAISFIAHLVQGVRSKSWTFLIALGIGTFGEAVGYVGRLMLRNNPWSRAALGVQLVLLTVCPAFLAGGIYLVLKHIIIIYGARFSRIAPRWYTWIFIFCDIISILVQAAGAVIASQATNGSIGNDVMMVGLVSQVVTLAIFGLMAVEVFFRIRKFRGEFNESTNILRSSAHFKYFLVAYVIAYITIFIRCVYRIAEMSGGWRNAIMQNQIGFIVLDSVMCVIAVYSLNLFHPGFIFDQSSQTVKIESSSPTELEQQNLARATHVS